MRVYKAFQRNFTPMDNELLRCREISVFAKTIYLFIDSHCDAWEFSVERIAWALNISVDRARAGIKELENIGLLERERLNNAEGKKGWSVKYYLHDKESSPKSDYLKSIMEKSIMEKSIGENPASNRIIPIEKKIVENKDREKNTSARETALVFDAEKLFEAFWSKYPRKVKRQVAFLAFEKALSNKPARGKKMPKGLIVTPELIMQGLERWLAFWRRENTQEIHMLHPATWLNDMCYLDELETPATTNRDAIAQFNQKHGLKGDSAIKGYYNLPRHLQEERSGNWEQYAPKTEEERKERERIAKELLGWEY